MSLWNFVKNVGAKLMGASEDKPADAEILKAEAVKHGLDLTGIDLAVDGDKVTILGRAASTEELEKIMLAVGNTAGVAQVESVAEVVKSAPESRTYQVKKGDSLWHIAEHMYGKGNGAKFDIIFQANRPMLSDPDKIYPGQILRVPDAG